MTFSYSKKDNNYAIYIHKHVDLKWKVQIPQNWESLKNHADARFSVAQRIALFGRFNKEINCEFKYHNFFIKKNVCR